MPESITLEDEAGIIYSFPPSFWLHHTTAVFQFYSVIFWVAVVEGGIEYVNQPLGRSAILITSQSTWWSTEGEQYFSTPSTRLLNNRVCTSATWHLCNHLSHFLLQHQADSCNYILSRALPLSWTQKCIMVTIYDVENVFHSWLFLCHSCQWCTFYRSSSNGEKN